MKRIKTEKYEFIYSGGETPEGGVGVLISKKISQAIMDKAPVPERIIQIRIGIKLTVIKIIQV